MNLLSRSYMVVAGMLLLLSAAHAEGTRQLEPTTASKGQLCINKYRNDFAFYDAQPEFRLNISIANTSETIRFGFGRVVSDNKTGLMYRIKGPAQNIVVPQSPVPIAGTAGFISNYDEAVAGPFPGQGGYNYLEFHPATSGDYFLEFYYPARSTGRYEDSTRRILESFDITVISSAGVAVNGRVWSKAWQFWSGSDSYSNIEKFYGKMMILSDDGIVTQVDCNGFKGGSFSFSSNSTGCDNTGIFTEDGKSREGFYTRPQFKVFLNDPDITLFPTQTITAGIIPPVQVNTQCNGVTDFGLKVDKDCTLLLLINVNPNPGADPEDVQIVANIKANPGGTGFNIIHWDGNDNYGKPVANGKVISFTVTNLSGLTHLPIYDIENNENGYIVTQIRPAGGVMKIFWDDLSISGGTANSVNGCNSPSGCHKWNNNFGDRRTINSWWFVSGTETVIDTFSTQRTPGLLTVHNFGVHCAGVDSLEFSVTAEANSTGYHWSWSWPNVTSSTTDNTGLNIKLNFTPAASTGVISVRGTNSVCGDGPLASLPVTIEPLPLVTIDSLPAICYTAPGFKLSGGQPLGGNYSVNGIATDSLYPYKLPEGRYSVKYYYTNALGCSNSDTSSVLLFNSPECQGTIFFPKAFSPNGDSANDVFRPVVHNIYSFKMFINNRWGQHIYSTDNIVGGWDGTLNGTPCPEGSYTYEATYAPSLRTDEQRTKRGIFSLIR